MYRHQIHSLRQILKPSGFSIEATLLESKKTSQILRLSTKSSNSRAVDKISKTEKELENVSSRDWIERTSVLKAFHFSHSDCSKIVTKHPDILQIPLEKFENTVKQWNWSNLEMNNVRTILMKTPILLEVEHGVIRKRLSHLHAICGSSDLLTDLLMNSPCVMFDDWNVLLEKIDYLSKVRGFQIGAIVGSFSLSRSLDLIKFRFDLLEKCGIYKQMPLHAHKINKYDKSQHKNPNLKDILELNDKRFSTEVAKISLEEYNFCYDLFMADDDEHSDDDCDDYHHKQER